MVYKPKYLNKAKDRRLSKLTMEKIRIEAQLISHAINSPEKMPSFAEIYLDIAKGSIAINIAGKEFGHIVISEINKYHEQCEHSTLNL